MIFSAEWNFETYGFYRQLYHWNQAHSSQRKLAPSVIGIAACRSPLENQQDSCTAAVLWPQCKRGKWHYSRKSKSLRRTRKALWAFLAGKGQDDSFLRGSFQTSAYYTRKDTFCGWRYVSIDSVARIEPLVQHPSILIHKLISRLTCQGED